MLIIEMLNDKFVITLDCKSETECQYHTVAQYIPREFHNNTLIYPIKQDKASLEIHESNCHAIVIASSYFCRFFYEFRQPHQNKLRYYRITYLPGLCLGDFYHSIMYFLVPGSRPTEQQLYTNNKKI